MTSVFGSEPSSLNEYEWCSVQSCAVTVLDPFLADDQSRARYRAPLMTRVNQITLYSVPSNALQMKSMGYYILDNQITNSIRVWFGLPINLTKKISSNTLVIILTKARSLTNTKDKHTSEILKYCPISQLI